MKFKIFTLIVLACLFVLPPVSVLADDTGDDEMPGCDYKLDDNGDIKSIKCPGESEFDFNDREDIREAKKKAQMRAKAEMAKFLKERLQTDDELEKITTRRREKTGESASAAKKSIETQREYIKNSADEILKGVLTLKSKVNKDEKYAYVEVGANLQTMKAADQLRGKIEQRLDKNTASRGGSSATQSPTGGIEVKKSSKYDDF